MSEALHHDGPEHQEHTETSRIEKAPETNVEKNIEAASEEQKRPAVETIKHKIEEEAVSAHKVEIGDHQEKKAHHPLAVNKELKAEALQRTLNRTRKHLSAPNRSLSKAVHQPVVDAISKVGEKTIARPTGVITGAVVALLGSSYVFYTAKHYGFSYNYLIVFILFAGGYILGLILELLVYSLRHLSGHK